MSRELAALELALRCRRRRDGLAITCVAAAVPYCKRDGWLRGGGGPKSRFSFLRSARRNLRCEITPAGQHIANGKQELSQRRQRQRITIRPPCTMVGHKTRHDCNTE
jgi:hypothetical protein